MKTTVVELLTDALSVLKTEGVVEAMADVLPTTVSQLEDRGVTALGDLGVWRLFVARPPATG